MEKFTMVEIKNEYTTKEVEKYLNVLNNVLAQKNKEIIIKLTQSSEDGRYNVTLTKEALEDAIALANEPALHKEKLLLVEYVDKNGELQAAVLSPTYLIRWVDLKREEGLDPSIVKIVECYPTIADMMDQEILHKMINYAEKIELSNAQGKLLQILETFKKNKMI